MPSVHEQSTKMEDNNIPGRKRQLVVLLLLKIFKTARWITCYFYSKQVILSSRHTQRPFLGTNAAIPNIRNLEHCRPFSLLHYNNFKVQSSVWHLRVARWSKWEQDLVPTELITSVLYFHCSEGSNAYGLAVPQIQL